MTLIPVPFHEDLLWAAREGERVQVAVKAICESIGVAWHGQFQRIQRDAILREGVRVIGIPSPGGVQETVCLPLELLPGFLFGIDDRRIRDPERRAKVLAYKRECHAVLFRHFFGGGAGEGGPRDAGTFKAGAEGGVHYGHPFGPDLSVDPTDMASARLNAQVGLVRACERLKGRAAANRLWAMLGLPDPGPDAPSAQDAVALFGRDGIERAPGVRTLTADLWDAFVLFCRAHDLDILPRSTFEVRFARLGYSKGCARVGKRRGMAYSGIRPRAEAEARAAP